MHKWRQVQRRGDKLKDVYLMGLKMVHFAAGFWEQQKIPNRTKWDKEENKSIYLIFKSLK